MKERVVFQINVPVTAALAYADGIKPTEFGGSNGTADVTKAVLAAL